MSTELFPDEYADVRVRLDRVTERLDEITERLTRIEETTGRVDALVEQVRPALAMVIAEVNERGLAGLMSVMMSGMRPGR